MHTIIIATLSTKLEATRQNDVSQDLRYGISSFAPHVYSSNCELRESNFYFALSASREKKAARTYLSFFVEFISDVNELICSISFYSFAHLIYQYKIGKVDIRAIDPTCPSWVKLQSVTYGTPFPNIALGKPASQSSSYGNSDAGSAVDGIEQTYTHTLCELRGEWWKVDLGDVYTISSLKIVNRLDCCGGRLHDFKIYFLDENEMEVDIIFNPGHIGDRKTFSAGEYDLAHNIPYFMLNNSLGTHFIVKHSLLLEYCATNLRLCRCSFR